MIGNFVILTFNILHNMLLFFSNSAKEGGTAELAWTAWRKMNTLWHGFYCLNTIILLLFVNCNDVLWSIYYFLKNVSRSALYFRECHAKNKSHWYHVGLPVYFLLIPNMQKIDYTLKHSAVIVNRSYANASFGRK